MNVSDTYQLLLVLVFSIISVLVCASQGELNGSTTKFDADLSVHQIPEHDSNITRAKILVDQNAVEVWHLGNGILLAVTEDSEARVSELLYTPEDKCVRVSGSLFPSTGIVKHVPNVEVTPVWLAVQVRALHSAAVGEDSSHRIPTGQDVKPHSFSTQSTTLEWNNAVLVPNRANGKTVVMSYSTLENSITQAKFDYAEENLHVIVNRIQTFNSPLHSKSELVATLKSPEGQVIGYVVWNELEKQISWFLEDIVKGFATDSTVPGGLRFEPDFDWLSKQALTFWKSRFLYNENYSSSIDATTTKTTIDANDQNFVSRFENFVLSEGVDPNCNGCSGLHFLDNTFFRPCCDRHDRCYAYPGGTDETYPDVDPGILDENGIPTNACGWGSWIFFWRRWNCTGCNLRAVACFATMSIVRIGQVCEVRPIEEERKYPEYDVETPPPYF